MDLEKLPDNEMKPINIDHELTMQKRRYLLVMAGLMLINILLFVWITPQGENSTYNLYTAFKTLIFGSIILGFGLGLLTAKFPHKSLNYSEKYLRASLLNIVIIQILIFILQICYALFTLISK